MKRTFLLVAAVGLTLALPAASVEAQRPFSFGIAAGASMPTGDAGDLLNTGFNIGATLGFQPALLPVGVRIDALYNSFDASDDGDGGLDVISATANAVVNIPMAAMPMVSPYLIGGLGLYSADSEGDEDRQNEFGWNVGGGLRFNLAGFGTFIEARYNSFSLFDEDVTYVPITFGIMF
jgi:opacity protein-like surface antigen